MFAGDSDASGAAAGAAVCFFFCAKFAGANARRNAIANKNLYSPLIDLRVYIDGV